MIRLNAHQLYSAFEIVTNFINIKIFVFFFDLLTVVSEIKNKSSNQLPLSAGIIEQEIIIFDM